jgi:hypothetical protein
MPVEILTASQRTEWERFPEEIDEASLTAFFSYADDELEQIAAHREIHGRFAIAVAVGALRWLGFVPASLQELSEPAAALIASQLDTTSIPTSHPAICRRVATRWRPTGSATAESATSADMEARLSSGQR